MQSNVIFIFFLDPNINILYHIHKIHKKNKYFWVLSLNIGLNLIHKQLSYVEIALDFIIDCDIGELYSLNPIKVINVNCAYIKFYIIFIPCSWITTLRSLLTETNGIIYYSLFIL